MSSFSALFGVPGMEGFIATLPNFRVRTSGEFHYPPGNEWKEAGLHCKEWSARQFFVRLINAAVTAGYENADRAVEACELVTGVAFFLEMEWDGGLILRCSMQVVAAYSGDLKMLYANEDEPGAYYRFDYAVKERGQLFDHPFPHIHSVADGPPRFHFPMDRSAFPPYAFLEFVMINHAHELWLDWLIREFESRMARETEEALQGQPTKDFLENFTKPAIWALIPEECRKLVLRRLREASKDAVGKASRRLPLIDPELLDLNYWG